MSLTGKIAASAGGRGGGARFVLGVSILGACFSLALGQAWQLDTRWFAIVVIAIIALSVSMCFARVFSDFLLVGSFFCLPLASFAKWFWPSGYADRHGEIVFVGVAGVGLIDFVMIGLYANWAYRIFVVRSQPLPRLNRIDVLILWLLLAYLISAPSSDDPELAFGATVFLAKNALFYLYWSRNIESRHLFWLVLAFLFAILLETLLGSYQFATGHLLGIALDKGAGGADINFEMVTPGTEGYHRATGTSYDAHTLGTLAAMILPFPLALSLTPRLRTWLRVACMAGCAGAVLVILMSLSRSAWLGSAIALGVGVPMMVALWRERHLVPTLAGFLLAASLALPVVASFAYRKLVDTPPETLTVRFDQYRLALTVFAKFPFFGVGGGNWLNVYPRYDYLWLPDDNSMTLVHNVILWVAIEVGLFGVIPFICLMATTMLRLYSTARLRRDIPGRLALAALIGMMTNLLVGLTDPAFREPNVFLLFWLLVALAVALPHMPPMPLRPGRGGIKSFLPTRQIAVGRVLIRPAP